MDHQPVGVERLGQRRHRVVEPDHRDHQQGQHDGDDAAAQSSRASRRRRSTRKINATTNVPGEGELVHVAPGHPVGVGGHARGRAGRRTAARSAIAGQQQPEPPGHRGPSATPGRPPDGRACRDQRPPAPTATFARRPPARAAATPTGRGRPAATGSRAARRPRRPGCSASPTPGRSRLLLRRRWLRLGQLSQTVARPRRHLGLARLLPSTGRGPATSTVVGLLVIVRAAPAPTPDAAG